MTAAPILFALILSSLHPIAVGDLPGIRRAVAFESGETVIVAVIPESEGSLERRETLLSDAAETIAERTGKKVRLTTDLRIYLSLMRMEKRGVSEYEKKVLLSELEKVKDRMYSA